MDRWVQGYSGPSNLAVSYAQRGHHRQSAGTRHGWFDKADADRICPALWTAPARALAMAAYGAASTS